MKSRFSWKISIVTAVLAIWMLGMAYWQWERHLWKIGVISRLTANVTLPPASADELPQSKVPGDWEPFFYRRVALSGAFDFDHEIIIRNRRLGKLAGFHVVTPFRLQNSGRSILITRGFLPLGTELPEVRKTYRDSSETKILALLKEPTIPKFFSPQDGETGLDKPWVDTWLRVDVSKIQQQIPYEVLPVYGEQIKTEDPEALVSTIVKESDAGRGEILMYTADSRVENQGLATPKLNLPLPAHDTTPPPDIHLGYVWEWSFMALLTLGIGAIAQLPRPTRAN